MSCETCHETGWLIETRDGVEFAQRCPVCSSEKTAQRSLDYARIPPRYFSRGFDVFTEHHPSQVRALKKAIEFVEEYPSNDRGLLFIGPCGVGKTHLSVAILRTLLTEKKLSGRFVDETEFLRRLHFSYGPEATNTESKVILPLMNVDLLVWDDLGTGRPTDWAMETIRMVLNHRYTYQKQTILTTNLSLKSRSSNGVRNTEQNLEERIGTRLLSRLLEMCEIVEIKGPDAREKIHKAGKDFNCGKSSGQPKTAPNSEIPERLVQCPSCSSDSVDFLDNKKKGRGLAQMIEMSCFCSDCSSYFIARYYPKTSKLEFAG